MNPHPPKTVKVAELKAHLSAWLREARRGRSVTVCDRETPIARLVPYVGTPEPLPSRPPLRPLDQLRIAPVEVPAAESLAVLLELRRNAR